MSIPPNAPVLTAEDREKLVKAGLMKPVTKGPRYPRQKYISRAEILYMIEGKLLDKIRGLKSDPNWRSIDREWAAVHAYEQALEIVKDHHTMGEGRGGRP